MFIFVCDQSPSMGVGGKLDTVKAAIEGFCGMYVKQSMAQPLMLLGCCNEGSKSHMLRSSIVDPVGIFEDEMKMMTASSASEEVGADFSQAVDYALSILSKFRLRDSIDAFGFGRKLTLSPAHIFIFADKRSQRKPFKLNKDEGYLHDFVSHPYRWDQHIYLFVIDDGSSGQDGAAGQAEDVTKSGLAELAYATGGNVFTVSSMREARSVMTTLVQSIINIAPTVTMRFALDGANGDMNDADADTTLTSATMRVPQGERTANEHVFVPEDTLIEGGMENLPQRASIPTFKLVKTYNGGQQHQEGEGGGAGETVQACWQILKDINLPSEGFEVTSSFGSESSYFVCTSGGSTSTVFGILSPNRQGEAGASSSHEMRILPANFPTLMKVIKTGMQINNSNTNGGGFGDSQAMLSRFRSDFEEYVSSIPGYCVAPVMKIMHNYGIAKIAHSNNLELQQQMQYKLHARPYNRIQKWTRVARAELSDMEIQAVDKMPPERIVPALNPASLALASSSAAHQQLPVGPYTRAMPKSVTEVPKGHTLAVWENMRKAVFGGNSMVFRGLSVTGLPGNGCRVPAGFRMKDEEKIWFDNATGATFVPRVKPREMSEYVFTLARGETLRDPEAVSAESTSNSSKNKCVEEEDTEPGILKRKLSAVNFGNRFNNKKGSSGSAQADVVDIDGIEGINNTMSATTSKAPSFTLNTGSAVAANISEDGDGLFADTPYPERDPASPAASPAAGASPATSHEDNTSVSSTDSASAAASTSLVQSQELSRKRPREVSTATAAAPPLVAATAAEWRKEFSKTQQRHYWFNVRTKKSTWEDPTVHSVKQ